MTKQEKIREGIAEFNYYYPDGKPALRRKWELLTAEEKKPYLDVARLQVFKLHTQGVVIKKDMELPTNWDDASAEMNRGNLVATEPIIEEK